MCSRLTGTACKPIKTTQIGRENTFILPHPTRGCYIYRRPCEAIISYLIVRVCGCNGKHHRVSCRIHNGGGLWACPLSFISPCLALASRAWAAVAGSGHHQGAMIVEEL